jgi:pimeloyl-ACP methyl ester carboxylesterase
MPQAQANGLTIEYDITGPADAEPVLLIMGLGAQMTRWPQGFLDELASRGLRVIRFDNRDVGLTTRIDAAGPADMPAIITALMEGRAPPVAYTLSDMAADAVGLLDALDIARAHAHFFGEVKPTTGIYEISALIAPQYKVEIEFTAWVG